MIFKSGFSLIMTIVDAGFSVKVIEAGKMAGADGATVINGIGRSVHDETSFMGVSIHPDKEIILILVKKSARKDIMKEIVRSCNLATEGKGLTFCLPVDEVAGISHLFKRKKIEKKPKTKEKADSKSVEKDKPAEKGQ